jgi:hypothetical protein
MESPTAAEPAISLKRVLPKLEEYCFREQTLRVLQRESDFEELSCRSHQIHFVNEFAQRHEGRALSLYQLSRAFECDAVMVKAALKNGLNDSQGRGRHSAFDNASEIEILEWVQNQAERLNPITRIDLLHYYLAQYSSFASR